jgi:O-antigen biosynthesis protein
LDDLPLIGITYNISNPVLKFIKKTFDFILALFALFLIYPFIYLAAHAGKKRSDFIDFILKIPKIIGGKYSFVGPRTDHNSDALYLGKPGLTGLWYIEGSKEKENQKLDIFYAKNQNIWLDIEILGKTINKMWGSTN